MHIPADCRISLHWHNLKHLITASNSHFPQNPTSPLKHDKQLFKIERDGEKLERPISSSGLWLADDDDETIVLHHSHMSTKNNHTLQ
jgi:hypothetical protein